MSFTERHAGQHETQTFKQLSLRLQTTGGTVTRTEDSGPLTALCLWEIRRSLFQIPAALYSVEVCLSLFPVAWALYEEKRCI